MSVTPLKIVNLLPEKKIDGEEKILHMTMYLNFVHNYISHNMLHESLASKILTVTFKNCVKKWCKTLLITLILIFKITLIRNIENQSHNVQSTQSKLKQIFPLILRLLCYNCFHHSSTSYMNYHQNARLPKIYIGSMGHLFHFTALIYL